MKFVFLSVIALCFSKSVLAVQDCADFTGTWVAACNTQKADELEEIKISQKGCSLMKFDSKEKAFALNGRPQPIDKEETVTATWEPKNKILSVNFLKGSSGIKVETAYYFEEPKTGEFLGSRTTGNLWDGETEYIESCTLKKK